MKSIYTDTKQPLVSIVIPTYNHARELKDALQSVIDQTVNKWEAWVINNYSPDDTINVIDRFNDSRIHRVDIHNNGIIAKSRNEGIRRSKGELIVFLDSDDVWMPNKLERVLHVFNENPNVDLVCHWENIRRHNKITQTFRYGPETKADYLHLLFERNLISTSAATVKRKLLEKVSGFDEDPSLITAEDYDLWLRLAHAGCRIYFLREVLGEYRLTGKNMSSRVDINCSAVREVVTRHYYQLQQKSLIYPILFHRRLANIDYSKAWAHFRAGNKSQAFRNILIALVKWPISLRTWFTIFRFIND